MYKRFAALESGTPVEDELQALKKQMLSGQGSGASLPAASESTKAAVDRELEDLRSQIEGSSNVSTSRALRTVPSPL